MTLSYEQWCRSQWELMNDGGVWGIPRSGLVFKKDNEGKRLLLVNQMPHDGGDALHGERAGGAAGRRISGRA